MIIAGSILKMSFLYPLRNVYMYEYCQCGGCLLISKSGVGKGTHSTAEKSILYTVCLPVDWLYKL